MHRQAITEVYLTDCASVDDGRFLVGAQWPWLHAFFRTCWGHYDTMLLAETVRQCAIYLAHVRYAVPMNYKFTMQRMLFAVLGALSGGMSGLLIGAMVGSTRKSRLRAEHGLPQPWQSPPPRAPASVSGTHCVTRSPRTSQRYLPMVSL